MPYCLDNPLPEKDFSNWCEKLSGDKTQRNKKYYPHCEYLEIGFKQDHVHLYMVIPPKYSVSKVTETKKNISRPLSIKFAFLQKVYWDQKGI